jgi:hypothetical protein
VTSLNTSVTENSALGGAGGSGVTHRTDGSPGQGIGGGLYVAPLAVVRLDAFTLNHVKRNRVSTTDRNIHGPYVPIS